MNAVLSPRNCPRSTRAGSPQPWPWQRGKKLEIKPALGRSLPSTASWVRGDPERGLMVQHTVVTRWISYSAAAHGWGARLTPCGISARVCACK